MNRAEANNKRYLYIMLNDKVEVSDGIVEFEDKNHNCIHVDINKGLTSLVSYKLGNKIYKPYMTVNRSTKVNGYVYTTVYTLDDIGLKCSYIGTHVVVAMADDPDTYIRLLEEGKVNGRIITIPVVNHKNNIPWDNKSSNLEWATQKDNQLHGKIIKLLNEGYSGKPYTYIERNMSKTEFVALKVGISITDIYNFLNSIGETVDFFKNVDVDRLNIFIDYLKRVAKWPMDIEDLKIVDKKEDKLDA